MDLDDTGAATLFLLNPTGGVLGGDRLDTRVELGAGTWVCLATPSATRVYRSGGAPSVQRVAVSVGAGARLEYVPDHVIPSPGARLAQSLHVEMAPGAAAIVCDAWSAGRVVRGEVWRFDLFDSGMVVQDAEGLLFKDRIVLGGTRGWDGLGAAEGMAYVATFLCVAPSDSQHEGLTQVLLEALAPAAAGARAGITPLPRGGALVRILASSAPAMQRTIAGAWAACRRHLWNLPPKLLRKM